jgi:hypothetical protein
LINPKITRNEITKQIGSITEDGVKYHIGSSKGGIGK